MQIEGVRVLVAPPMKPRPVGSSTPPMTPLEGRSTYDLSAMEEPTRPDPRLDGPVDEIEAQDGPVPSDRRVHVLHAHAGVVHRQRRDLPYASGQRFGADLRRPGDDGGEGLTNRLC